MLTEQYFVKESSAIIKSVFDRIAKDKETDIIIIPGDLTKNGEKESHKSFVKELYKLKESGKRIFVITAGHDYNDSAYVLQGDGRVPVEGTDFNDLCEMYRDFGYGDALAIDEPTHSYVAEVSKGIRMIAICCDSKNQPKGAMDERLTAWIKEQIDKAKKENCCVFAICHYPIIPSVPAFDLVGDAKIKEWQKVASFLADNGVELVLTGHMHIQSINEFYSEKGYRLIDICTGCLVGSPAKYRKISVKDNVLSVESVDTPEFRTETDGESLQEFFDKQFIYSIQNRILGALDGGKGFAGMMKKLGKKIVGKITVGCLGRLLWIKTDKSIRKIKLIDLAGNIGIAIFKGDMPYGAGTPEGDAIARVLKRFGFIIRKVEPKLSKNGIKVNLTDMLLDTVSNNKGFSDNNAVFTLDNGVK